jgi:hypothetical protein
VTTPDQLRAIVEFLQSRVRLVDRGGREITFSPPTAREMTSAGFDDATVARLLSSPWWPEMVDDVIETPDFAEPEARPEVVLGYARDVIGETIGKRFQLEA